MPNNPSEQLKERLINLDMDAKVEAPKFIISEDGLVPVKNRLHHDEL